MTTINLNLFSTIIAASVAAFLGLIVYFHDRKNATNVIFTISSIVFTVWAIVNYFSVAIASTAALPIIRFVMFLAPPQVFLLFLFAQNFPHKAFIVNKKEFIGGLFLMLLLMSFVLSDFVFESAQLTNSQVIPKVGKFMPAFAIVLVISAITTFFVVDRKYRHSEGTVRRQWFFIALGFILAILLLIVFVFLQVVAFNNPKFVPFAPLFILPIFIGASYAILKHHLFSIKVIATEILTFLLLIAVVILVLTSTSLLSLALSVAVAIFTLVFGILLVRSVLKEVEQREKLQELTGQLTVAKIDLEGANAKLVELDKLKSEFLSFASHQVKSPMTVIKGFAQLIADGSYGQISDEAKAKALKIKESTDRTIALVNNLLDLKKIEESKMEFSFSQVDIAALTRGMVEEFQIVAKARGLGLFFESSSPSLKIKADEQKIRQVIQNLLDNSLKYTERGFVKVKIEEQGDYVVCSVIDSGRGMSQELIRKLFGRFVRDEQTKKEIQGTGLGLYIAKEIVNAHHGSIYAESDGEGKGSRFFVKLAKQ